MRRKIIPVIKKDIKKESQKKTIKQKIVKVPKVKTVKMIKRNGIMVVDRSRRIKGDPESKDKLESQIQKEIEIFLDTLECHWADTKNKGEPHALPGGKIIRKKGANPGYQDITVCLKGRYIAIEAKSCDSVQGHDQVVHQEDIQKNGEGFYFLVTSVRELIMLMVSCGLLIEVKTSEKK